MVNRWMAAIALLALMIPLMVACGDDDDDSDAEPTATSADAGGAVTATTPDEEATEPEETEAEEEETEAEGTGTEAEEEETGTEAEEGETATESTDTAGTPTEATDAGAEACVDETITIGSKNFTEQLILGEMYAQLLEDRGCDVERQLNLGGTAVAHEALVEGEIDMYPEYTGTGLLAILNMETMSDPDEVYEVVSEAYLEQFNLVWLDQTPMNNSNALAVTREFSEERGITTISQLVEIAGELTLAAVPDFPERPDGMVGLNEVYGDFEFGEVQLLDPGLKYQAFLNGEADVVLAFGTDGEVAGHDLVILEDDKGLWPPYHVAPVVRQDTLDANPGIADALNELAPLLTSEIVADLNWEVGGPDAREPADVAHDFLVENDLIEE